MQYFFEEEREKGRIWQEQVRGADFCFCVQDKEMEPPGKTINDFELNQLNCLSWGLHLDQVYFLAIITMMIYKKKRNFPKPISHFRADGDVSIACTPGV